MQGRECAAARAASEMQVVDSVICAERPCPGSTRAEMSQQAIAKLWQQQLLCDVQLKSSVNDGEKLLGAHRLILSANSGFFHAMFCGAGLQMREGIEQGHSMAVVPLPYPSHQLATLLSILYEQHVQVTAANVFWLLDMASYLEVQQLLEACCDFLRSALSPGSCVDVLLLAHHYHCHTLQQEAVLYLAQRLSSLLLNQESRTQLCRLPHSLLEQVLSCEALEVEQEAELLCFVADWVLCGTYPAISSTSTSTPEDQRNLGCCQSRQALLPQLLSLLQLSALPEQPPLTQQQLAACISAPAAQLAQQLHRAAVQCPQHHHHQQQQQQQLPGGASTCISSSEELMAVDCLAGDSQHLLQVEPSCNSTSSSSSTAPFWQSDANASDVCWGASGDLNNLATASASSTSGHCMNERIGAVLLQAWPGRQRGYQPTKLLVAGGHDLSWRGLKGVELYDPLTDSWGAGPALPAALPFAGCGTLGRSELYVVGGGMYSTLLARLDGSGSCWHLCEGPKTPRLHAAVTGAAGLLYVVGGRSQVNQVLSAAEVYDPSSSSWRTLPDMKQPRYAHAVASLAGSVYAVGGQASKSIHRSVEAFDAERCCWELLPAQLSCERKYCGVASLGGRLMVLGGMTEARSRLSSMEGYDPREGKWRSLTPMQHARSSCGVAALGGRLYAVGGNAGDQLLHAAVEEYDPAAGRWRSCAALACGRSGLLAAAV